MKNVARLSIVCLVLCLLAGMLSAPVYAADLINNRGTEFPTRNAVANIQRISGKDAQSVITSDDAPGIALCRVSELDDVEAFIALCEQNRVIPTLQAETAEESEALLDALRATSCKDITVISSESEILKAARNRMILVRTGLIVSLESDTITSKEAAAVRREVRAAPATFCVIDDRVANRAIVSELQELAVAVWIDVTDETNDTAQDVRIAAAFTAGANGIISADADETTALASRLFVDNTMTRTPVMIGHRGNPTQTPENSLSGFLTAYENGADVFEVDVEITKDDEIVIMHDSTLKRTTDYDGDKTIGEMTLSEIKQYHLLDNDGNVTNEQVPTLREVLEEFKDKDCRIFVEFKGYNKENVTQTAAILKELDMEDRVDVISFNTDLIAQTQKDMPGMSTGYLQSPGGITKNPVAALNVFFSSIVSTQSANSTINPGKSILSTTYMQVATDRGMTVWPWTYAEKTNNLGFLNCPDGLTTDDMQWVTDMYKTFESDTQSISATVGKPIKASLYGVTYGGESVTPSDDQLILSHVSGDNCIALKNGVLTAIADGKATILVGCKTQTTDGTEYVLYTEPITVKVHIIPPLVLYIGGGVALLALAIVIVLLLRRKKAE